MTAFAATHDLVGCRATTDKRRKWCSWGAVTGIIASALVRLVYREGTRADRYLTNIL
jgi:hypothetical protein